MSPRGKGLFAWSLDRRGKKEKRNFRKSQLPTDLPRQRSTDLVLNWCDLLGSLIPICRAARWHLCEYLLSPWAVGAGSGERNPPPTPFFSSLLLSLSVPSIYGRVGHSGASSESRSTGPGPNILHGARISNASCYAASSHAASAQGVQGMNLLRAWTTKAFPSETNRMVGRQGEQRETTQQDRQAKVQPQFDAANRPF